MTDSAPIPKSVVGNIDAVLELERRAELDVPPLSRLAHGVGAFVGSVWFVALHLVLIGAWLAVNSGWWSGLVFDAYPFPLLGMVVSAESVILTTFVLVKQNREAERASQRSNLDLHINLLAEKELTKVLQIVQRISDRVGAASIEDPELTALLEDTAVRELAAKLDDRSAKMSAGGGG